MERGLLIFSWDKEKLNALTTALNENFTALNPSSLASKTASQVEGFSKSTWDTWAEQLSRSIDPVKGGLQGRPKFPNTPVLLFLWRAAERSQMPKCRGLVLRSLERMCQGGLFDQIGGGFHRYSTDENFLVPHFEKMLYDQSHLLQILSIASVCSQTPPAYRQLFRARASSLVAFVKRELFVPEVGFLSSLDADSDGEEGAFYMWTSKEVEEILGTEAGTKFAQVYGISEQNSIPNRLASTLKDESLAEEEEVFCSKEKLLGFRTSSRRPPHKDDKVLTDWSALMIMGLARSAVLLNRVDWLELAEQAYSTIVKRHTYTNGLLHSTRKDKQLERSFALDYAGMALAALELDDAAIAMKRISQDPYVEDARKYLEILFSRYVDQTSGLLRMECEGDLICQPAPIEEDAIGNAHSFTLEALGKLNMKTEELIWRDRLANLTSKLLNDANPRNVTTVINRIQSLNAIECNECLLKIGVGQEDKEELRQIVRALPWYRRALKLEEKWTICTATECLDISEGLEHLRRWI